MTASGTDIDISEIGATLGFTGVNVMSASEWGFISVAVGWTGIANNMMICVLTYNENNSNTNSDCIYDVDVGTITNYLEPGVTTYTIEFGDGINGAHIYGVVFEDFFLVPEEMDKIKNDRLNYLYPCDAYTGSDFSFPGCFDDDCGDG